MIFVCTGSRQYPLDRLLKTLDDLVSEGVIKEEIFAQTGNSNYRPVHYEHKPFLSADEFKSLQQRADLIISHGGTGALIGALKIGKQVIAVPRLPEYGEHMDDHQKQVSGVLEKEGYLRCVYDMGDLRGCIEKAKTHPIIKKYGKESRIITIIEDYIEREFV